jgi:tetratricopeptide (TPR) repeat protein
MGRAGKTKQQTPTGQIKAPPASPRPGSSAATNLILAGLIVAAGLVVYANSFSGVFLLDDGRHIVNNESIRHLWPVWDHLIGKRRPLVSFSLAANYALGELEVRGYHAFNLAVHLLAALTLFGLIRRTLLREQIPPRYQQAAPWLAAAAALIWVVHPLNSQSVNYVIQRSELMMGLFYLLTLYCVVRGADSPRRRVWFAAAVAACALSMASKAVAVTAPLVVLLYDRAFIATGRGGLAKMLKKRWGLYLGLAATWSVPALCGVARGVLNPSPEAVATVGFGFKEITPLEYARTQPSVLLHYLRLCFWPHPLCLDYLWPVARTAGAVVWPALVILALLIATGWALLRRPAFGFLGAWFFIILAPTSSFIPIADVLFEHRMYLPLAAVVVLTVIAGHAACGYAASRLAQPRAHRWLAGALIILVTVPLGLTTTRRNRDYRSEVAIWSATIACRPQNARAHNNLGVALKEEGQLAEAIESYRAALRCKPDYDAAYVNLGNALQEQGDLPAAIDAYRTAVHYNNQSPEAHYYLAIALTLAGKHREAVEQYRRTLDLRPGHVKARNNLGTLLLNMGDHQQAAVHFAEALRIEPRDPFVLMNLGNALVQQGNLNEAIEHYRQAVRVKPDFAPAQATLAGALAAQGRLDESIEHYREALRIEPQNSETLYLLGRTYEHAGRTSEAIETYRQTLRLAPGHGEARRRLDALQAQQGEGHSP